MAKAIRHFYGNDSYGRAIEKAQREDGAWFCREYGFNGFGKSWSSWASQDEPTFETHGISAYTGEKFKYDTPVLMAGFNVMHEIPGPHRIRLPNH
ncbi:hypothetical protein A3715_28560 [Oleiphilus sp. HI0009]|nr:hypothetical protein A3715_19095 [Oleiphilus sp. HI0009]KZX85271.1 hypothetical protein A3715_28560 [Oleiphilus sp. HI0009]